MPLRNLISTFTLESNDDSSSSTVPVGFVAGQLKGLLDAAESIEPDTAQDVTELISSLLATSGPGMDTSTAFHLQGSIEALVRAAPADGSELILTSSNLNITIVALSALGELPMIECETSNAPASVLLPPGLLSSASEYDASRPTAALLFTTSGAGLHNPLASPSSVSASPTVSFSLLQDGVALSVSGLVERLNLSIPFELTPDPEGLLDAQCRWYDHHSTNWSTRGCLTGDPREGSITCSCDHLTDFAVIESPLNASEYMLYREHYEMNLLREQLVARCLEDVTFGYPAFFSLLAAGFVLLLHALWRDRRRDLAQKVGPGEPYYVDEYVVDEYVDPDANVCTVLWRGARRRYHESKGRGGFLNSLCSRHPLVAGICSRGLHGYTRCQTIQMVVNTMAFEMAIASLFPIPSPVDAPAVEVSPATVVAHGAICATAAMPSVLFFAFVFHGKEVIVRVVPIWHQHCRRLFIRLRRCIRRCVRREPRIRPRKPLPSQPWDEADASAANLAAAVAIRSMRRFATDPNAGPNDTSNGLTPRHMVEQVEEGRQRSPGAGIVMVATAHRPAPEAPPRRRRDPRAKRNLDGTFRLAQAVDQAQCVRAVQGAKPKKQQTPEPAKRKKKRQPSQQKRAGRGPPPTPPPSPSPAPEPVAHSLSPAACGCCRSEIVDAVATVVPNPFIARSSNAEVLLEQSLSRAIRRRDRAAIWRIAIGWVANWGMLLLMLSLMTRRSCYLLAGPAQGQLALTWGCAVLLRVFMLEPLLVLCALCASRVHLWWTARRDARQAAKEERQARRSARGAGKV